MKLKNFLRMLIIIIVAILLLSIRAHVVYGDDEDLGYDNAELTDVYYSGGGNVPEEPRPSPTPPRDDPRNENVDLHEVHQTKSISGRIVEKAEAKDSQELGGVKNGRVVDSSDNIYNKGISDLGVELFIDGNSKGRTTTGSDGGYSFSISGYSGVHSYNIKYSYPNISNQEIDKINNVESAKKVQKKLVYNGQDYQTISGEKKSSIEISGKGVAQVYILLDCSKSMENSYVAYKGKNITKLQLEKIIAEKLVEDLLSEEKNIVIGLIVYRGQNYRKVSLTDNKSRLLEAINGEMAFTETGYTNIVGALDKAYKSFANNNKNNSNRYVFLLSDGLPTSDGTTRLYRLDGSGEIRERIKRENETRLKTIAQNTSNKINELENEGVTIFSAISIENTNQSGIKMIEDIYLKNKNSSKNNYLAVKKIEQIIGSTFIKNLKENAKNSVKITDTEYKINTAVRGDKIKEKFEKFINNNTLYFEALDMNIQSNDDIEKFKQYAKQILNETYTEVITPQSSTTFFDERFPFGKYDGYTQIHYVPDENGVDTDEVDYIEKWVLREENAIVPDSCLEKLPPFTLTPTIAITNAKLTNTVGNIIKERKTTDILEARRQQMNLEVEHEQAYGARITLQYTIELLNQSVFSNKINNIGMNLYVPEGFRLDTIEAPVSAKIIGNETLQNIKISAGEISQEGINSNIANGFLSNKAGEEIKNMLKDRKHVIGLYIDNTEKAKVLTNGKIQIKVNVSKLLSGEEYDDPYNGEVEIITYSNEAYRRLLYNVGAQAGGLNGAVAGNKDKEELDYATSNDAQTLVPTGENRSHTKVYISIIVLTVLFTTVLIIRKKTNKK